MAPLRKSFEDVLDAGSTSSIGMDCHVHPNWKFIRAREALNSRLSSIGH